MIHWIWAVLAFIAGELAGIFAIGFLSVGRREDATMMRHLDQVRKEKEGGGSDAE